MLKPDFENDWYNSYNHSILSKILVYTNPCAIIELATFTKPAMFAPFT